MLTVDISLPDVEELNKLVTEGIKVADLPLTFRESVELCRGLGIPFLWIDSLCIIQDDLEDWKNEARRMAIIYDRATLTIAAADGIDSSKGLHIPDPADAEFRDEALRLARDLSAHADLARGVAAGQGRVLGAARGR